MKRFRSTFLFGVIASSVAFAGKPVATITSAVPFALDGHSVNTPGVSSFPVIVGDTVATSHGPAVLVFSDGSALKLGSNSSVRIAGVDAKPKIVLLAGALDYKLVPGSTVSVTNLDSEHHSPATTGGGTPHPAASVASVAPFLRLRPGQVAQQAPPNAPTTEPNIYASFLGEDTATLGNWRGKYGTDGQMIAGDSANLPSYAKVNMSGDAVTALKSDPEDPRGLQTATANGTTRVLSAYANNFTIDLNLTDGAAHKVSLYLADIDHLGRSETITIVDPTTQTVLSSQSVTSLGGGVYESWNIRGHVEIKIASTGQGSALVNGIFFDGPAPGAGNSGASASPNSTHGLLTDPLFLIPLAGAAAAGIAAGLLALPTSSANQ